MKLFLILSVLACADVSDTLLRAIAEQESGFKSHPKGWNGGGKAKGWYQCHKDYWTDGCQVLGKEWPWTDAHDYEKSTKIVKAYLEAYGKAYKRKTGKEPTDEVYSMIHHFGPNGWKNPDRRYWNDIERRINKAPIDKGTNATSKVSKQKISKSGQRK